MWAVSAWVLGALRSRSKMPSEFWVPLFGSDIPIFPHGGHGEHWSRNHYSHSNRKSVTRGIEKGLNKHLKQKEWSTKSLRWATSCQCRPFGNPLQNRIVDRKLTLIIPISIEKKNEGEWIRIAIAIHSRFSLFPRRAVQKQWDVRSWEVHLAPRTSRCFTEPRILFAHVTTRQASQSENAERARFSQIDRIANPHTPSHEHVI
jgi:hypothetical protein